MADTHFAALKAGLQAHVAQVLGCQISSVIFGSPQRECPIPGSVVRAQLVRSFQGPRAVQEDFSFRIELRRELTGEDPERSLVELAFDLVYLLAPYSLSAVPATPTSPYAGVGYSPQVAKIETVDVDPMDGYEAVALDFSCTCTAYQ